MFPAESGGKGGTLLMKWLLETIHWWKTILRSSRYVSWRRWKKKRRLYSHEVALGPLGIHPFVEKNFEKLKICFLEEVEEMELLFA
jgi:hypothetical protein